MEELSTGVALESSITRQTSRYRKRDSTPQSNDIVTQTRRLVTFEEVDSGSTTATSSTISPEDNPNNDEHNDHLTDIQRQAHLLLRALLDILRFTYNIDYLTFESAMGACTGPRMHPLPDGGFSFLARKEKLVVYRCSAAIDRACSKLEENHLSILTYEERAFIINWIIQPARLLNIEPAYMFEQLMVFPSHGCLAENQKKTLLYANTTSIWPFGRGLLPGRWSSDKKQRLLARRLVSDEIAITELETQTSEELRLLLGHAIAEFGRRHCRSGMSNIERRVYADPIPTALAHELQRWELMIQRQRNGQYTELMRPRSQSVISTPTYYETQEALRQQQDLRRFESSNRQRPDETWGGQARPRSVHGHRSSESAAPPKAQRRRSYSALQTIHEQDRRY